MYRCDMIFLFLFFLLVVILIIFFIIFFGDICVYGLFVFVVVGVFVVVVLVSVIRFGFSCVFCLCIFVKLLKLCRIKVLLYLFGGKRFGLILWISVCLMVSLFLLFEFKFGVVYIEFVVCMLLLFIVVLFV